jgi:hypothetical protein
MYRKVKFLIILLVVPFISTGGCRDGIFQYDSLTINGAETKPDPENYSSVHITSNGRFVIERPAQSTLKLYEPVITKTICGEEEETMFQCTLELTGDDIQQKHIPTNVSVKFNFNGKVICVNHFYVNFDNCNRGLSYEDNFEDYVSLVSRDKFLNYNKKLYHSETFDKYYTGSILNININEEKESFNVFVEAKPSYSANKLEFVTLCFPDFMQNKHTTNLFVQIANYPSTNTNIKENLHMISSSFSQIILQDERTCQDLLEDIWNSQQCSREFSYDRKEFHLHHEEEKLYAYVRFNMDNSVSLIERKGTNEKRITYQNYTGRFKIKYINKETKLVLKLKIRDRENANSIFLYLKHNQETVDRLSGFIKKGEYKKSKETVDRLDLLESGEYKNLN